MVDPKPRKKRVWLKWLIICVIIGLLGAWYFIASNDLRYSDEEVADYFEEANIQYEIDNIPFLNDSIRYIQTGIPLDQAEFVVLFVHGAPGSSDSFYSYQIDSTLLQNAHLISMDRLGYGYSMYGAPIVDIQTQADAVTTVMDHVGAKDIVLVSHSFGCAIAGIAVLNRPQHTRAHIMLCPVVDPLREKMFFFSSWPSQRILKHFFSGAMQVSSYEKMIHADELVKIESQWSDTTVPTLVMHGREDWIAPVENASYLKGKIPSEFLTVEIDETASHFIPWTQHIKVVEKILHFL